MLKISSETKKTGYYKSVKIEVLSKAAQKMLEEGDSIERVARVLDLDIEEVRKLAEKQA